MDAEPSPPYQRDESAAQRLDRNWNELLQEIRVLQTGSQILAAFLIVLPFQSRFEELDAFQTGWYLGLLLLGLVIVAVPLTAVLSAGTVRASVCVVLLVLLPWRVARCSGGSSPCCPSRPTFWSECLGRRSRLSASADGQGPARTSMSSLRCSVAPTAAAFRPA